MVVCDRPGGARGDRADRGGGEVHLPLRLELGRVAAVWRDVQRHRPGRRRGRAQGGALLWLALGMSMSGDDTAVRQPVPHAVPARH